MYFFNTAVTDSSALEITPEVAGPLGGVLGLIVGLVAGVLLTTGLFRVFCECKTSKQSTYLNEIPLVSQNLISLNKFINSSITQDTGKDFIKENEHCNSKTEDDYGIQKP